MRRLSLFVAFILVFSAVQAQKKKAKNGKATIFSKTIAETIRATNNNVISNLDLGSGKMVFVVPVQSFQFKIRAMQRHFNQPRFMNSKQYPKIKFVGNIQNFSSAMLKKDGKYEVEVVGNITIRGTTKPLTSKGSLTVAGGEIKGYSKFVVENISAYGVGKPKKKSKKNNVAENIECEVWVTYQ